MPLYEEKNTFEDKLIDNIKHIYVLFLFYVRKTKYSNFEVVIEVFFSSS